MVGGGGDSTRAEAERCLDTSENLLASSDFHGAKAFAIRACEADPSLTDVADYILAISDTLIAGETKIGDSKSPDWYKVLRLNRLTRNPQHVATQYRRLALLLNPNVNHLPFADQALKLVSDAWYVLSDPQMKSMYDRELKLSQIGQDSPLQSLDNPSFWTTCPYCYSLFEYPKGYEECILRCQECKRAFEAVKTQTPPVGGEGVYFCSVAMFPLGYSGHTITSSWSPVSHLFVCPTQKAPPRKDDDNNDIYVTISDDDEDRYISISDDDCRDDPMENKKRNGGHDELKAT